MSDKNNTHNRDDDSPDIKQQAIKFKAFQHTFSSKDINGQLDKKRIMKKLKASKQLEKKYNNYLEELEKNPLAPAVFPWDSRFRLLLYWLMMKLPTLLKGSAIIFTVIFVINYIPGPTQHIAEFIIARALYDTTGISRLPANLETYGHSAKIVGSQGGTIKFYGRRKVTKTIPDQAKNALMACEDHYLLPHPKYPWYVNTFLVHAGVSWVNLAGAVKDTLMGNTRGASTIIMQNAKKVLGNDNRTVANKLEEIIISYMLVSKYGKEKNLNFYINTVPVGNNIYGFPAAARYYFKRELDQLNYQQLVTIGSFIPNHNRVFALYDIWQGKDFDDLSPGRLYHVKSAINKVNLALSHLAQLGEISEEELEQWQLTDEKSIRKIGFRKSLSPLYGEEEWTSWNVIKEVTSRKYMVRGRKITGARLLLDEQGDVVIETNVDLALVEKIKEIVDQFLDEKQFRNILRQRNKKIWLRDRQLYVSRKVEPPYDNFEEFMEYLYKHLNIGVIITNNQGRIIAYVGGKEFLQGSGDQETMPMVGEETVPEQGERIIIDLMNKKAKVAPSSTIKPLVAYYAMVSAGADLRSLFTDKPLEYKYIEREGEKVWLPRNWYPYDGKGQGNNRYWGRKYSLLESQVLSVNTIFARIYSNPVVKNSMLAGFDRIGLDYNRDDAKSWPFGIGASDLPVQQWLGVYNAFLDGYYHEPSFVTRITINGEEVYTAESDLSRRPTLLFDAVAERQEEMRALYEVCSRGSGATMKSEFKYHSNLVSGKTGTAPNGRTSLFVSHFNPYQDRYTYKDNTMSMIVVVTTNTGGYKSVGASTQGPTKIAGRIYDYIFKKEMQEMSDQKLAKAKDGNPHFRNNHVFWANTNRYMEQLMDRRCKDGRYIYENIVGVDNFQEALNQILNPNNRIYTGDDKLFRELVNYYCDQEKMVPITSSQAEIE